MLGQKTLCDVINEHDTYEIHDMIITIAIIFGRKTIGVLHNYMIYL